MFVFAWAAPKTCWNYESGPYYKNTYRRDILFGFSRTYIRNLKKYLYEIHIGRLLIIKTFKINHKA